MANIGMGGNMAGNTVGPTGITAGMLSGAVKPRAVKKLRAPKVPAPKPARSAMPSALSTMTKGIC